MLDAKEVAKLLNISVKKVYRLIDKEKIPVYKIGDEYKFNRVEICEWATLMGIKVSGNSFQDKTSNVSELPQFIDALCVGGILYDIDGRDKTTVLRNVVESLKLPVSVNREIMYEVLIAREKLGSTGIGDGIAIPHVRNPVILNVNDPTVTLSFLKYPIEFESIDKLPVSILFTIISPAIRVHLHLLSRLSQILQNSAFKAAIKSRAAPDVIMKSLADAEATINSSCSVMQSSLSNEY